MEFEQHLTHEQLHRIDSWLLCLNDALAYIALAQNRENSFNGESYFRYAAGTMNVHHAISRALIAAAIVSASQIFKKGEKGPSISGNDDKWLKHLQTRLFVVSDTGNNWEVGRSEAVFKEKITKPRDQLISHYDGRAANIRSSEETGALPSWSPPNPWFRPEAFLEVESMISHMYRSLWNYARDERLLLEDGERK